MSRLHYSPHQPCTRLGRNPATLASTVASSAASTTNKNNPQHEKTILRVYLFFFLGGLLLCFFASIFPFSFPLFIWLPDCIFFRFFLFLPSAYEIVSLASAILPCFSVQCFASFLFSLLLCF
jgi:hypothetical protein